MQSQNDVSSGVPGVGHTPHLIVVDDEPAIREICADVLSSEGYQVSTAGNGREAVELVTHESVDLVLMDIMMPIMDGLSACRAIKADTRTCGIPVIIMSATHNLRERTADMQGVAAAIVPKPFDFDQLLDTVHRLVSPPLPSADFGLN